MSVTFNKIEDISLVPDVGCDEPAFIRENVVQDAPSLICVTTATSTFGVCEGESLEVAVARK